MKIILSYFVSIYMLVSLFVITGMLAMGHRSNVHGIHCEGDRYYYHTKTRWFKIYSKSFRPAYKVSCYLLESEEE